MFNDTRTLRWGDIEHTPQNWDTIKKSPVWKVIEYFQSNNLSLISKVEYWKDAHLMPQLIWRAASIAYINEKRAKQSYDDLQRYKQLHMINDLWISLEDELALAIYIFTYNDSKKPEHIKTILKELWLSWNNTNIPSVLQELCTYYSLPSARNPDPISNPLEK